MHHRLKTLAAIFLGLGGLALAAHAMPTPDPTIAGPDAALYPGGRDTECAIAVAALRMTNWGPVDPLLRGAEGTVDCGTAFQAAGIATKVFTDTFPRTPHLYVTRPRTAPNGKPYVAVCYQDVGRFHKGMGFDAEQMDGGWVVDPPSVWMS